MNISNRFISKSSATESTTPTTQPDKVKVAEIKLDESKKSYIKSSTLIKGAALTIGTGVVGLSIAGGYSLYKSVNVSKSESPLSPSVSRGAQKSVFRAARKSLNMSQLNSSAKKESAEAVATRLLRGNKAEVHDQLSAYYTAPRSEGKVLVMRDGKLQVVNGSDASKKEIKMGFEVTKHVLFKMIADGESKVPQSVTPNNPKGDSLTMFLNRLEGREPTKSLVENDPKQKAELESLNNYYAFKDSFSQREEWSAVFNSREFTNLHDSLVENKADMQIELYTEASSKTPAEFKQVKAEFDTNYEKAKGMLKDIEQKSTFGTAEFNEKMQALENFVKLQLSPQTEMMNDLTKALIKERNPNLGDVEKQEMKDSFVKGNLERIRGFLEA